MEKKFLTVVKAVLLLSAATLLILRLVTFKGFETMDKTLMSQLNLVAYVAGGLTLVSGLIWVFMEKRHPKAPESYSIEFPDFDKKSDTDAKTEEQVKINSCKIPFFILLLNSKSIS